jgi:hypothetical protein
MSDLPKQSSSRDEHQTMSSQVPAGQLSPVVLIPTPIMPQTLEPGTQSPTEAALPGSQDSNPSQTSPHASNPTLAFPIMKLPPELRLMVFDQLFFDLTVRRRYSMKYRNDQKLLQKHQANDFRPYTNILLTCKELNTEAKKLWEEQYLRECCFYFWHVSKLYDLAVVIDKMGKAYTEIKYVLRSHWAEDFVSTFCLATTVANIATLEAEDLIVCQPGVSPGYPEVLEKQLYAHIHDLQYPAGGRYTRIEAGIYEATEENPVRLMLDRDQAGKSYAHAEHIGLESCVISVHQDDTPLEGGGTRRCFYTQMQGKFSGIFWGGYDAAVGYGKFKLWEAVPFCPGFGYCHCSPWHEPENRFDCSDIIIHDIHERQALLQRWYEEIVDDHKWLNLGGKPGQSSEDLMDEYGLTDWFDFDYWGQRADRYWASWHLEDEDDDSDEEEAEAGAEAEGEAEGDGEGDSDGDDEEQDLEWLSPSR